jgi:hypothetical protein
VFTAEARAIYEPSHPETKRVYGRFDPLAVRRELVISTGNRLNDLLDVFEGEGDELAKAKAERELAAAARSAFSLPPVTAQNGVTDAEGIGLLYDFLDYLGKGPATDVGSPNTSPCVEPAG